MDPISAVPEPVITSPQPHTEEMERRSFMTKAAAAACGAIAGLVPMVAGILFFLDPLRKRGESNDYVKVADLSALPADGEPVKFSVIADQVDAWNRFPKQSIGAVYLRQSAPGEVVAFNVICPHLGCAVDYRPAESCYHCPCHDSSFASSGDPKNQVPPRGLDTLEVDPHKLKAGEIWIKFQNFKTGLKNKIAKS